jgi:pyridoxal phosphate enzyme (YggS family)
MGFQGLGERVAAIRAEIAEAVRRGGQGQEVRLIAVTKTHGPEAVTAAFESGITDVGENKVQEALRKKEALMAAGTLPPVTWHLIGHLQTNKVKALPQFGLFHAMDRPKLADEAAAMAARQGITLDVLLQVNVVDEESKGGYPLAAVAAEAERLRGMPSLRVTGVMTMAPFDADERVLRTVFAGARAAREQLQAAGHPARELSMGMSGDYLIAVEEGATLVRLGTILFGARG